MSLKKETPSDILLHLAALRGDVITLKRVLDSGRVHVDCRDEDGTTPLMLASASGHYICVVELLEQGADPNLRRVAKTTPLFFAAQGGFLDIVKILIKSGANIDTPSMDGSTALFVGCQGGHVNVVRELIKSGAYLNSLMKDGATPVFIASQNGHGTILNILLVAGAKPDLPRYDGTTPLYIASQMGHDHICKILLQNGADVDAIRCDFTTPLFKAAHKGHSSVVAELLKYNPTLYLGDDSVLHAAALFGNLGVIKQLVAAGCDIFYKNKEGLTAFDVACQQNYKAVTDYLHMKMKETFERQNKNAQKTI